MTVEMLKGKIHRATVVQAELDYVGSITVDEELLEAAGIMEYEKVQIVDVNNGSRFETYTICGKRGSGMICLNGAAARCVSTGDKVIIMCYANYEAEDAVRKTISLWYPILSIRHSSDRQKTWKHTREILNVTVSFVRALEQI